MKKLYISLALFLPFIAHGALLDGLVSYWNLNEEAGARADLVGVNNLVDNETTNFAPGVLGNGANFSLSDTGFLSIDNSSQTGLSVSGDVSFSTWVKLNSILAEGNNLFAKDGGDKRAYAFSVNELGNLGLFFTSAPGGSPRTQANGDTVLDTGVFYHVVGVADVSEAGSGIQIYVNGVPEDMTVTDSGAVSIANTSAVFGLGTNTFGPERGLDGLMDEAGLWNRALTAEEILELYNSGTGLTYPFLHTVSGVSITPDSLNLNINEGVQLVANLEPSNADNKAVSWSSNNEVVAKIDADGLVTGIHVGSALITVKTDDGGFTAQTSVTVLEPAQPSGGGGGGGGGSRAGSSRNISNSPSTTGGLVLGAFADREALIAAIYEQIFALIKQLLAQMESGN